MARSPRIPVPDPVRDLLPGPREEAPGQARGA